MRRVPSPAGLVSSLFNEFIISRVLTGTIPSRALVFKFVALLKTAGSSIQPVFFNYVECLCLCIYQCTYIYSHITLYKATSTWS